MATAIPLYISMNPRSFVGTVAGSSSRLEMMDPEDVEYCFGDILRKIGLKYPQNVSVAITDGIGPTSMGMDGPRGGIIFFPFELFAMMNPATPVTFDGVYDGPIGQLPLAQREELLADGYLVPTKQQIQFIFGHEAAHLKHRHTYETSKIAVLVALLTHFGLKLNNHVAHSVQKIGFMQIRNTPLYVGLIMSVTASVIFALSWDQELQADATAAKRLELKDDALQLKLEQLQQNKAMRKLGAIGYDAAGNDWTDLEHPPTMLQMINLKWLKSSIKDSLD